MNTHTHVFVWTCESTFRSICGVGLLDQVAELCVTFGGTARLSSILLFLNSEDPGCLPLPHTCWPLWPLLGQWRPALHLTCPHLTLAEALRHIQRIPQHPGARFEKH